MASSSDSSTPRGEPWVWFTGLGLIIGLGMVLGLLTLVILNGVTVFWAPQVPVAQVDDGRTIIGQLAQRRIRAGSTAENPRYERQYQVGLRELNGNSYLWVDETKIKTEVFPADVLGLERVEHGPAFVRPQSLRKSDGKVVPITDPVFESALQAEVAAAAAVREKFEEITRHRIGDVNHEMDEARVALRRAEDLKLADEIAVRRRQIDGLEERFVVLKAEAQKIVNGGAVAVLDSKDAAGREVAIPLTQIVRAWFPNRLDTWGRTQLFASRLGEFIFDEPREANTEGGLMPAIFGTLVMTVFMSLLVTPFGVITAIYLREYAQQGPVLRIVRISVNNLAGVPSIVFGVFGLGFFVYVLGGSLALGYFGFEYYQANKAKLRAVALEQPDGTKVLPTIKAVQDESYRPLSRPLFIYVNDKQLQSSASLRAFVGYSLSNGYKLADEAGAIPLIASTYRLTESKIYRRVLGSAYAGSLPVGLTLKDILNRSLDQDKRPEFRN